MLYHVNKELAKLLGCKLEAKPKKEVKTLLGEWSCSLYKFEVVDDPRYSDCVFCVNSKSLYSFVFPLAELSEFEDFNQCFSFRLWLSFKNRFKNEQFLNLIAPDLFTSSFVLATDKKLGGIVRGIKGTYNRVLSDEDEGPLSFEELCYEVNTYRHRYLDYRCPLQVVLSLMETDCQLQSAH